MTKLKLDHVILTVSDLERSRRFYRDILEFDVRDLPTDIEGLFAGTFFIDTGNAHIFFLQHAQTPPGDRFNELRIGLDHLAFSAPDEAALHALVERLKAANVPCTDVKVFELTGNQYVVFRDPDNIQLEYWLPSH
ncbi:MAG: VOC family protein [Anaerolineae bacterium]|nr:VOC family protein [Anaerolineae bacterium]